MTATPETLPEFGWKRLQPKPVVNASFRSPREARDVVEWHFHRYMTVHSRHYQKTIEGFGPEERAFAIADEDIFNRWGAAVQDLERKSRSLSVEDQVTLYQTKARALKVMQFAEGQAGDLRESTTGVILKLIRKVVDLEFSPKGLNYSSRRPRITLESGFIGPVADIANNSKVMNYRLEALDILSRYPRKEGIWDGLAAAAFARRKLQADLAHVSVEKFQMPYRTRAVMEQNQSGLRGKSKIVLQFSPEYKKWAA